MDQPKAHVPAPPSERSAWIMAVALCALGVAVLALIAAGVIGRTRPSPQAMPPAVVAVAPTPLPAPTRPVSDSAGAGHGRLSGAVLESRHAHTRGQSIVGSPTRQQQSQDLSLWEAQTSVHIPVSWMAGFYPIYAQAQRTFGVNWLLIASIHRQESAFSTDPTTYKGLNFAGCCGGPMQFNVTNGPVTTWSLVSNSFAYGHRPAAYDHMTAKHPSIYDDFDSIMAAAHLLSADGAGLALDGSAWDAAYDYYGHDLTGVTYADQVLARAIGWSQHGWCINCGVETRLVEAVHAAYGAPVAAALESQPARPAGKHPGRRRKS